MLKYIFPPVFDTLSKNKSQENRFNKFSLRIKLFNMLFYTMFIKKDIFEIDQQVVWHFGPYIDCLSPPSLLCNSNNQPFSQANHDKGLGF